jgi:hypothetical protein
MLNYGGKVFTVSNFVVVVVKNTTCVKGGGLITEKDVTEEPHICIDLLQHKCHRLDLFRLIMQLDVVQMLQFVYTKSESSMQKCMNHVRSLECLKLTTGLLEGFFWAAVK